MIRFALIAASVLGFALTAALGNLMVYAAAASSALPLAEACIYNSSAPAEQ